MPIATSSISLHHLNAITMERLLLLLSSLLAIMGGCYHLTGNVATLLNKADRLVEARPDSALSILKTIDASNIHTETDSALFFLLLNQAQYKLYLPMQCDSMLDFCVNFYSHSDDKRNQCRAYYYKGMTLVEKGKYEKALTYLKEGELVATGLKDDLYLFKFYDGLRFIFANAHEDHLALHYAKLSLEKAKRLNFANDIAAGFSNVYMIFGRLGYRDSAAMYLRRAIPLLDKIDRRSQRILSTNLGNMNIDKGDYTNAKKYILRSINIKPSSYNLAALADIYLNDDDYQKALETLESIDKPSAPLPLTYIYEKYALYYKSVGDIAKTLLYTEKAKAILDSLRTNPQKERLRQIEASFDKRFEEQKEEMHQPNRNYLFYILAICASVWGAICIKYITGKERKIVTLSDRNEDAKYTGKKETSIKGKIVKLSRQLTKAKSKARKQKDAMRSNWGIGKEMYEKILSREPLPIDVKNAKSCLVDYFIIEHHNQYAQWEKQYKNLTNGDIAILIMTNLGYDDTTIANILGVGEGAVRTARSRLKGKQM